MNESPACDHTSSFSVSGECFKLAFERTATALAILDTDTLRVRDANQSFFDLLARPAVSLLGSSLSEWPLTASPDAQARFHQELRSARAIQNQDLEIRRPGGEVRNTLWSVAPLPINSDSVLLLTLVDVTDQRSLELQLRQAQEMDAIGQIAAGVAHDFNNLLTVIVGHAGIHHGRPNLDAGVARSLDQIKRAGERAAGLTRQLLAFSRKQVAQLHPLNPINAARNIDKMLTRLVGNTIKIEYDYATETPAILADESNFEQVLLNLVVNARDAMPGGGTARIAIQPVTLDATARSRHPEARPGHFVQIAVQDNGVGMDSETMRRIFEPFFTTKPVGKGTGLGLSTVYGIVKQHDGWLEVESAIGRGTTFRVFLPVTDQVVPSAAPARAAVATALPSGTVLVVEDEHQIREFVCEVLRQAGFKVLDAECARSALKAWAAFGDEVDLALVDLVLPNGLSGPSLAKILKAQNPELSVVFTSGCGADDPNYLIGSSPENTDYLQKPFGQGDLLRIVQKTLALRGLRAASGLPASRSCPGLNRYAENGSVAAARPNRAPHVTT